MIGRQNTVFMKKLLSMRHAKTARTTQRCFSSQVATTSSEPAAAAGIQTLWQYSDAALAKSEAKESEEAAYLDTLKKYSSVPGAYQKLSETGSSEHLVDIRKRINKVVAQEIGLIEFKNGDIVNKPGENEGSAKVLSYAALSDFDKETTLKLWGQYYREVKADPDGDSHANIRNFMKYGWDGVPFENGIALTKKNVGDGEWDWDAESWIP